MIKSEGNSSVKPIGLNKKGIEIQLSDVINDAIIYFKCTIDGEGVGEKLHVFDILSHNGKDLTNISVVDRLKVLDSLHFGTAIEVVKTAYTREEKQKMFEEIKNNGKEGIVFKKKSSPYTAGRPNSGGNQFKFKLQKTGTFLVSNHTKGKRSVGLQMINENGEKIFLGKVTIPPNKPIPNVGDFIEVQYLYAFKAEGGCVFQPVFLKNRSDECDESDISISQLVYKVSQEDE